MVPKEEPIRRSEKALDLAIPIAEIFTVLILGNVIAGALLALVYDPATLELDRSALSADTDFLALAGPISVSMIARFGTMLLLGFLLYRLHHRQPSRAILAEWGVGTGGHSVGRLLAGGVLLFAVGTLPLELLFLANAAFPFGEGLGIWALMEEAGLRSDLLLFALLTSVLLPPLLEEPIARGYLRCRLADGYGMMGGVVLSGVVFTLAHGQYFAPDPVLILSIPILVLQSICWAYVTWKTGSLIPAILAHALMNAPYPHTVPVLAILVAAMIALVLARRAQVAHWLTSFAHDWRETQAPGTILLAVLAVALILVTLVLAPAMQLVWLAVFVVLTAVGIVRAVRGRGVGAA